MEHKAVNTVQAHQVRVRILEIIRKSGSMYWLTIYYKSTAMLRITFDTICAHTVIRSGKCWCQRRCWRDLVALPVHPAA